MIFFCNNSLNYIIADSIKSTFLLDIVSLEIIFNKIVNIIDLYCLHKLISYCSLANFVYF